MMDVPVHVKSSVLLRYRSGRANSHRYSASTNEVKEPRRPSIHDKTTSEQRRTKKAMTVQELCKAPFVTTTTAAPWTTITDDDNLVSHLLSVYFTWHQPTAPIIHRDAFFDGLESKNIHSPYCSPLLVNIILSIASVRISLCMY